MNHRRRPFSQRTKMPIPNFIQPMLAKPGRAFDSDKHLFEIKWDGIRAMTYIDSGGYRMMSRRGIEITQRYPEFAALTDFPAGTILDGELVVLDAQGRPEFRAVLTREQTRSPLRLKTLTQGTPANYIVFDQLYHDGHSLLRLPLRERRARLIETINGRPDDRIAVSDGVIGPGTEFFSQILARDMEGIVAKRLDSRYQPGQRTDDWIKARKSSTILCAIIGYVPKGDDFESLIIASDDKGELRYVGRVGTGFPTRLRVKLHELLRENECRKPLIRCKVKGAWVQAGLYCSVRYLEMTKAGELREPVFQKLITD